MTKNKTRPPTIKLLFIPLIIIILIIITFISDFFQHQKLEKLDQIKTDLSGVEKYLPRPTATPTLTIDAYTVYNLDIKTKTDDKFNFENFIFQFANPIIRSFDLSDLAYTDSFRIYSSPKTTKTNHQYILMTIKNADLKPLYENDQYRVTLTPNDSLNIKYLYGDNYCQTNSDCLIKDYFCRYGAFNKYERIRTSYGCEGNIYDYQNDYHFGPYDEVLGCKSQVIYQSTKCIDNKCVGQNRTIKCIGKFKIHS